MDCLYNSIDTLNKPVGFYGPIAPPGPNARVRKARRTSCPILSSKCAQILNFRTRSLPNLWTLPMSSFWTYPFAVRLCHTLPAANGIVRCATGTGAWSVDGCCICTCVMATRADFNMYLLRQFCSKRVKFFYNTQETQTQKNDGPEFWNLNYVIFDNFLVIFKKASRGPSAVDLDHYGRGQTRLEWGLWPSFVKIG